MLAVRRVVAAVSTKPTSRCVFSRAGAAIPGVKAIAVAGCDSQFRSSTAIPARSAKSDGRTPSCSAASEYLKPGGRFGFGIKLVEGHLQRLEAEQAGDDHELMVEPGVHEEAPGRSEQDGWPTRWQVVW